LGFFPAQAVGHEPPAPTRTLQKKSCLKSHGRFFGTPRLCHNRAMNDENTIMNDKDAITINAEIVAPDGDANGEAQMSEASLPGSRTRNGKIARLPLAIRWQLNQRLQDGQPGQQLVQWLNGLPEVQVVIAAQFDGQPIGEKNLSRWKNGGYQSWAEEQKTMEEVAALFEQSNGLQEAAQDGLTDRLALVLAAKMAAELNRLDSVPDGESKSRKWRELLAGLAVLRRGEFHLERLRLERERIALRRELGQKKDEAAFWQWAEKEENREKVRRRLLTPKENAREKKKKARILMRKLEEEIRNRKTVMEMMHRSAAAKPLPPA